MTERKTKLNHVQAYDVIDALKQKTVMVTGNRGEEGAICKYADPKDNDDTIAKSMAFPCSARQVEHIRRQAIGHMYAKGNVGHGVTARISALERRVTELEEQLTKPAQEPAMTVIRGPGQSH